MCLRRKVKIIWLLLIGILITSGGSANATELLTNSIAVNSRQLIIVTADNWNSVTAKLQRYQRINNQAPWQPYGKKITVVVGKNGMAWSHQLLHYKFPGPLKKENDLRTPVGLFKLGPAFGFAAQSKNNKFAYLAINSQSVCVDDVKSIYYNQIIDTSLVEQNSWHSGERMLAVPGYKQGAVVQYNMPNPILGQGSCIFMHIWKSADQGTAGCVAMPSKLLTKILNWLDAKKNPVILIVPQPAYSYLTKAFGIAAVQY